MTSRRTHKIIWWLLPLLALRSLVPAGLMIDTSQGGVSMVVCTGVHKSTPMEERGAPATTTHDHLGQHGHDSNAICPFAVAATGAPTPAVLPMVLGAVSVIDAISSDVVAFHSTFGPLRVQQSRAPPYFS
jgi:hypothetical protein